MEDQSAETLSQTYTITSKGGKYTTTEIKLKIALPADNYNFGPIYDISETIGGVTKNAILIFMERENDNGDGLDTHTSNLEQCNFYRNLMTPYTGGSASTSFDPSLDEALIVVFHDINTTPASTLNDAGHYNGRIADILAEITRVGGPIVEYNPAIPRRAGMSVIKK